ncbi:NADPH-dependent FMN reductase [Pseudomonas sp. R-28-1W-6]|uniref:flavodoxin family protein n=1 Tax=Pseudomonas sp. R-28-1W-6 TaxID=2650101 RepID=UPI0013652BCD|nr:flavodoxin family protein [Pseudomonas sp. R-28-1W-6]MWV14309.1 NADPH-dependent FMN reductase [Pseudomonas sp. R-28-1W-6]
MSTTVAIIYHSGYGHTARVAEAVARGVRSTANTQSLLIRVEDIDQHWQTLEQVDAIVFGSPTYMGSVSAQFKAFMDATSHQVFAKGGLWANKVAAGFTNAASRSGDKLATLQQLSIFAAQHAMHWINLGLPPGHNSSTTTEDVMNRDSYFLGVGAQSNFDEGPELAPKHPDIMTAEHLGARVALVTHELAEGRRNLSLRRVA